MHGRESNRNPWDTSRFIWFYTLRRVDNFIGDDDWNLDADQWRIMSRCNSAAQCLIDIIRDGRCKPYSKIEAVKTLFAIVEKGKTEREVADALKSLKEQLIALEGGPVYDV